MSPKVIWQNSSQGWSKEHTFIHCFVTHIYSFITLGFCHIGEYFCCTDVIFDRGKLSKFQCFDVCGLEWIYSLADKLYRNIRRIGHHCHATSEYWNLFLRFSLVPCRPSSVINSPFWNEDVCCGNYLLCRPCFYDDNENTLLSLFLSWPAK